MFSRKIQTTFRVIMESELHLHENTALVNFTKKKATANLASKRYQIC